MISSYEQEILDEYDREMEMKGMSFLQPSLPILPSHKSNNTFDVTKSVPQKRRMLEQALNLMPATNYCTAEVKRRTVLNKVSDQTCGAPKPHRPEVSENAIREFLKAQSLKKETSRQRVEEKTKKKEEKPSCNIELKACRLTKKVSCESKMDKRIKLLKKKAQVKCSNRK